MTDRPSPKAHTVYIKTFGCSLNQSDSELMAGLLKRSGFDVIMDGLPDSGSGSCSPDAVIINGCTVKNLAESKFWKEFRSWKGTKTKIIVAGCISQAEPDLAQLQDVSVIGTRRIANIVSVVESAIGGKMIHDVDSPALHDTQRLNLPKLRKNGVIAIIPISEGCMSSCSFCKTKLARGELHSYKREDIFAEFRSSLDEGCREFWITSQDCGCYGFDIYRHDKYFLPQLISDMLKIGHEISHTADTVGEGFRIRIGMCNPDHIDMIKKDLIKIFNDPCVFKFLHIPVQSASDGVLKNMKRPYTCDEFIDLVSFFRCNVSGITISSDMIVGFPGESETDYRRTEQLVKDMRFEVLNISRFWARKGTLAYSMKQLPSDIIKQRVIRIQKIFNDILHQDNENLIGKTFRILLDEPSDDGIIGRTDGYRQVLIRKKYADKSHLYLGMWVDVRIIGVTGYKFIAEQTGPLRAYNI